MFSKFGSRDASAGNEIQEATDAAALLSSKASTVQPEAPKPKPKPNLSVIGKSVELKGELVAGEDLLIQGTVEGTVRNKSTNIVVGTEGSLKANVDGKSVVIQGKVNGDIHGDESVVIESSARVEGNISASSIGVEKGARFKGSIDTFGGAETARKDVASEEVVDKILDA